MKHEGGFESTNSSEQNFRDLRELVAEGLRQEKGGEPMPSRLKASLKQALAVLGMSLVMASPEALKAQQNDDNAATKNPQTEVYRETTFLKTGERKQSLVAERDVSVGGKTVTLTGSATYGGSIFVPERPSAENNQSGLLKEQPVFSEQSAGLEVPVEVPGPFEFTSINEIEHRPEGTAWFFGGEMAFKFSEGGKLQGTEVYIRNGKYFDITHIPGAESAHSLAFGMRADLKKFAAFSHLPIKGVVYAELETGREAGETIGIELGGSSRERR